eukprot:78437_1
MGSKVSVSAYDKYKEEYINKYNEEFNEDLFFQDMDFPVLCVTISEEDAILLCNGYIRENIDDLNVPNTICESIKKYHSTHRIIWKMSCDDFFDGDITAPSFKLDVDHKMTVSFFLMQNGDFRTVGIDPELDTIDAMRLISRIKLICIELNEELEEVKYIAGLKMPGIGNEIILANQFKFSEKDGFLNVEKCKQYKELTFGVEFELWVVDQLNSDTSDDDLKYNRVQFRQYESMQHTDTETDEESDVYS